MDSRNQETCQRIDPKNAIGSPQDLSQSTVRQDIAVSSPPLDLIGRNDMSKHTNPAEKPAAGWRLKLGAALFGLSIILPVLGVPLVTALGLSTTITASVSGALLVRDLYTVDCRSGCYQLVFALFFLVRFLKIAARRKHAI